MPSTTPARPTLRRAADCRVETRAAPGQAHRGAAGVSVDYRLQELTDATVRAISTVAGNFADKPKFKSPWHYHDCDLQVAIILEGSIELGYLANRYTRASKGDLLFIPGHTMHDVGAPSADYQIAEITFPGTFGTIEAPMPAEGAPTAAVTLGGRDAVRGRSYGGVVEYDYPIAKTHAARYAITGHLRSRTEPFVRTSRTHEDKYRMTITVQGFSELDLGDGAPVRTAPGDLLVVPSGAEHRLIAASDDYAAIEVRLLHG